MQKNLLTEQTHTITKDEGRTLCIQHRDEKSGIPNDEDDSSIVILTYCSTLCW